MYVAASGLIRMKRTWSRSPASARWSIGRKNNYQSS
jgi:hypothetical protein